MTNLPYQPAESQQSTPEQDVLKFFAQRLNAVAAVREQLENIVVFEDTAQAPEVDLSRHFNPSVPVGRVAIERMNENAQTMGNVINLAERQAGVQQQQSIGQSLWANVAEVTAQPTDMDVDAWEAYVNSLARSKGEIDLNDDIKKAA